MNFWLKIIFCLLIVAFTLYITKFNALTILGSGICVGLLIVAIAGHFAKWDFE